MLSPSHRDLQLRILPCHIWSNVLIFRTVSEIDALKYPFLLNFFIYWLKYHCYLVILYRDVVCIYLLIYLTFLPFECFCTRILLVKHGENGVWFIFHGNQYKIMSPPLRWEDILLLACPCVRHIICQRNSSETTHPIFMKFKRLWDMIFMKLDI